MKKNLLKALRSVFMLIVLSGFLSGCQTQPTVPAENTINNSNGAQPEFAVPSTKGPSGPPAVQGPDSLPPEDGQSAQLPDDEAQKKSIAPQAITEKENIRLTLPLKNT